MLEKNLCRWWSDISVISDILNIVFGHTASLFTGKNTSLLENRNATFLLITSVVELVATTQHC